MDISSTKIGGFDVVTLEGEFLTEPEQNDFRTFVRGLVSDGAGHLVIDLGAIRHINSCGLGSLVCALIMMKKVGGDFRITGVNRDVGKILELTRLDTVFRIYDGIREATGDRIAHRQQGDGKEASEAPRETGLSGPAL